MNFFIQGKTGIGKSYTIRESLKNHVEHTEGFMVQRLYEDNNLWGFRAGIIEDTLVSLDAGPDAANKDGIFLSPEGKDLSVLEGIISQVEKNFWKPSCQVVVLDEIGGFELCSDIFMTTLYRILDSDRLCVGVLKSQENLMHTLKGRGFDAGEQTKLYLGRHDQLKRVIESNGILYTMTDDNRDQIQEKLQTYIDQYTPFM